jgi:hypothetical protein
MSDLHDIYQAAKESGQLDPIDPRRWFGSMYGAYFGSVQPGMAKMLDTIQPTNMDGDGI